MDEKNNLIYTPAEGFVDLSKPYDFTKLYYEIAGTGEPHKDNTLALPIKKEYFDHIVDGIKHKVYRELKDTNISDYLQLQSEHVLMRRADSPVNNSGIHQYHNGYFPYLPISYKYLKLIVETETDWQWAIVEIQGISFVPKKNQNGEVYRFKSGDVNHSYHPDGDGCYWMIAFHLGKVIEIQQQEHMASEAALKLYDYSPSIETKPRRNFDYLKGITDFSDLYALCNEAEICQKSDPQKSALSCRIALEYTVKAIYMLKGFTIPEHSNLFDLVDNVEFKNFINDPELMNALHFIRKVGNIAAHTGQVTHQQAFFGLLNLHNFVGSVLMMLDVIDMFPRFDKELLSSKKEIYITPKTDVQPEPTIIKKYESVAYESPVLKTATLPEYFTEAETRAMYIDVLLKEAGWKVLTEKGLKAINAAGIEICVTGMPNNEQVGYVDYVLFGADGKPLALVEAKKTSKDPIVGKHQAELYAECLEAEYGVKPVIYYTNGYEIQCIDRLGYPQRRLFGFHTREDLELLIQRQNRKPISDFKINDTITNRAYQKQAITSICEHLNGFHRRGLLVMATGTGKTRVSISLVDVLMRNDWVKNVLFLADRTALVSQAHKNFAKLLPSVTTSVLSDKDKKPDKNARVLFSTYQTMVNFIDSDTKEFSVGRFDLIIIDEAHRSIFGKYMSIFNYFDAFLVGLTATPREEVDRSTYEMFQMEEGHPNYAYELEEAVADGFLNPYEVIDRKSNIL